MVYTFESKFLPNPKGVQPLAEGMRQGVHVTFLAAHAKDIQETIERWFAKRDDVILMSSGQTSKQEHHYLMLEWDEHEIDPVFLDILAQDDELIEDFTLYSHDMEE
jgi:hypothetical protein